MTAICGGGLLSRKSLLLAKAQTALGVDAVPTAALDAIQVADPVFSIDPNVLERNFTAPDLSPFEHVIGRKLASMTFTTEMKSNGAAISGLLTDQPKLARLLRGCGYELVGMSGSTTFANDTDVEPSTDTITLTDPNPNLGHRFEQGDGPVQLIAGGGTLPTGLTENTDYWIIKVDAFNIKLASTKALADAGTPVDITLDGTGVSSIENLHQVTEVNPEPSNDKTAATVTWTRGTLLEASRPPDGVTLLEPVLFTITVTTGGASGVAEVSIANNNAAIAGATQTAVLVTADAGLPLGTTASGATVTPDWTGDLVLGDVWRVMVYPRGIRALPVSDCFEFFTLYLYNDGLLYKMIDSQGTFTVDATAGNFASFEFTFTGQFNPVIDAALPTDEVFEATLPQQVELSLFTWGSNSSLIAEQWTFDQANNVVPRPDINQSDGFSGVRISDRTPAGGFNPQAELVASEDFWGDFSSGRAKVFTSRVGTTSGNQVVVYGPRVQVSEIGFGDRDGIRSFDMSMLFKRLSGDDETEFVFA